MAYYLRVILKESFYGLQRKIIECNNTRKSAFQNKTLSMGLFSMRGVEKLSQIEVSLCPN